MSEETKKDIQKDPAEATELSNHDLEQVAGGGSTVTVNKAKTADKAFQAMDGYIRG